MIWRGSETGNEGDEDMFSEIGLAIVYGNVEIQLVTSTKLIFRGLRVKASFGSSAVFYRGSKTGLEVL